MVFFKLDKFKSSPKACLIGYRYYKYHGLIQRIPPQE